MIASAANSRSASGRTTAWFFAPPSACTRFPCGGRRRVDVARDRRRADERDRVDLRMLQQRVDRFLVAVHDVEDAVRQPGLLQELRHAGWTATGSFSDGFRTNVLPHASATGNIHSGTIAGKLNGVMPDADADRLRRANRRRRRGRPIPRTRPSADAARRRQTRRLRCRAAPIPSRRGTPCRVPR